MKLFGPITLKLDHQEIDTRKSKTPKIVENEKYFIKM